MVKEINALFMRVTCSVCGVYLPHVPRFFSDDYLSQLMCASLLFIGIFICYFGHRFFKFHTFLIGFLSGLVVTYILVCLIKKDIDRPGML